MMNLDAIETQLPLATAQSEDAPQDNAEQDQAETRDSDWADLRHTRFATSA